MEAPSLSLAERFRQALDACDTSYAKVDQTPMVTEYRSSGAPQAAERGFLRTRASGAPAVTAHPAGAPEAPGRGFAGGFAALAVPEMTSVQSSGKALKVVAIAVGVLLLVAAGWLVRARFVVPFFERRAAQHFMQSARSEAGRARVGASGGSQHEESDKAKPGSRRREGASSGRAARAGAAAAKRVQFQEQTEAAGVSHRGGASCARPKASRGFAAAPVYVSRPDLAVAAHSEEEQHSGSEAALEDIGEGAPADPNFMEL